MSPTPKLFHLRCQLEARYLPSNMETFWCFRYLASLLFAPLCSLHATLSGCAFGWAPVQAQVCKPTSLCIASLAVVSNVPHQKHSLWLHPLSLSLSRSLSPSPSLSDHHQLNRLNPTQSVSQSDSPTIRGILTSSKFAAHSAQRAVAGPAGSISVSMAARRPPAQSGPRL